MTTFRIKNTAENLKHAQFNAQAGNISFEKSASGKMLEITVPESNYIYLKGNASKLKKALGF